LSFPGTFHKFSTRRYGKILETGQGVKKHKVFHKFSTTPCGKLIQDVKKLWKTFHRVFHKTLWKICGKKIFSKKFFKPACRRS